MGQFLLKNSGCYIRTERFTIRLIKGGAETTWLSIFNVLPLVSSDTCATLYDIDIRREIQVTWCLVKKRVLVRNAYKLWSNRKLNLEGLDVEGRITVRWILRKYSVKVRAKFIWFRVGSSTIWRCVRYSRYSLLLGVSVVSVSHSLKDLF